MAMSDMTLGQYFPAESVIHRLDARIKIVLVIAFMVLAFLVSTLQGYGMVLGLLAVTILLSRVPIRFVLKGLKPILFILIFTFVLNLFLTPGQTVWVHWWIFTITKESLLFAVQMSVRLALLVAGTSMLTLTTAPLQLTDGLESLLRTLKAIRFPVHEMAMMMSIALRFIPTLAEEADRIRKAQAARGADFDTGRLFKRAASLIPLLVPLFVGAFRRAEELATAMEARCYHGGEGRTKLTVMHMGGRDYISLLIMVAAYLLATVGGF